MAAQNNNGALALQLNELQTKVTRHERLILGNGQPGLVQRVAEMDAAVDNIEKSSVRIAKVAESLRTSVALVNLNANAASKTLDTVNKKITALEKILGPMVDWKKNIYIRVSTIITTTGVIFSAIGGFIYYFDKIKELFGF